MLQYITYNTFRLWMTQRRARRQMFFFLFGTHQMNSVKQVKLPNDAGVDTEQRKKRGNRWPVCLCYHCQSQRAHQILYWARINATLFIGTYTVRLSIFTQYIIKWLCPIVLSRFDQKIHNENWDLLLPIRPPAIFTRTHWLWIDAAFISIRCWFLSLFLPKFTSIRQLNK